MRFQPIAVIERLLLAAEAAEIFRIPKARVYELVRQGKLRSVRIGRLVRIPEEALEEIVKKGKLPQ